MPVCKWVGVDADSADGDVNDVDKCFPVITDVAKVRDAAGKR